MSDVSTTEVRECVACGRTLKNPKYRYCSKRCWANSAERMRRLKEWRAKRAALGLPSLPLPSEIAAECLAIQSKWSDAERIERMRPDWRPIRWEILCVPGSDGSPLIKGAVR